MAEPTHQLITLQTLKDWLGIGVTGYDDVLTDLILRISRVIERNLHWYFGPTREVTEYLDGTGTDQMYLSQPLYDGDDDPATLVLSCRPCVGSDWEELTDGDDYENIGRRLNATGCGVWERGSRNFRAVYDQGFEDVPGEIQQLALDMVGGWWKRRGREGVQSETIGDYSYSLGEAQKDMHLSPLWDSIAQTYRRLRI